MMDEVPHEDIAPIPNGNGCIIPIDSAVADCASIEIQTEISTGLEASSTTCLLAESGVQTSNAEQEALSSLSNWYLFRRLLVATIVVLLLLTLLSALTYAVYLCVRNHKMLVHLTHLVEIQQVGLNQLRSTTPRSW